MILKEIGYKTSMDLLLLIENMGRGRMIPCPSDLAPILLAVFKNVYVKHCRDFSGPVFCDPCPFSLEKLVQGLEP